MYISKIDIEGYKNCKLKSEIEFNSGLNIIVGENASGKTTIIDALRLVLRENESSYMNITEDDFFKSSDEKDKAQNIKIDLDWKDLSDDEEVTFLTWCDADFNAKLHFEVEDKKNPKGQYKKIIWGGASKASAFEEETYDCIDCIYLPPLRDAEQRLTSGRKSRLAMLLEHQYTEEEKKENLKNGLREKNESLIDEEEEIKKAKKDINDYIKESMGNVFGQTVNLQFSGTSFTSILRSIKMVFFPEIKEEIPVENFLDIAINSLGYNNLLYIATILAELEAPGRDRNLFTVLLIEEPEAHLHPQLQIKLIKYMEQLVEKKQHIQIIITTHSAVLASSVSVDNLIHLNKIKGEIQATSLAKLDIYNTSKKYINRWLDSTKSTLLFSKGVIFVEGISEAILLPEFAKIVLDKYNKGDKEKLPSTLEEAGVSVININGINFKHFYQLFCDIEGRDLKIKLPFRCSGITDKDPAKKEEVDEDGNKNGKKVEVFPHTEGETQGENTALELIEKIKKSKLARLYSSSLKTFEYDLAMENNIIIMLKVIRDIWPTDGGVHGVKEECKKIIEEYKKPGNKTAVKKHENSITIFNRINDDKNVGKGIFAQELADKIKNEIRTAKEKKEGEGDKDIESIFMVPEYIENAIIWACGGDVDE